MNEIQESLRSLRQCYLQEISISLHLPHHITKTDMIHQITRHLEILRQAQKYTGSNDKRLQEAIDCINQELAKQNRTTSSSENNPPWISPAPSTPERNLSGSPFPEKHTSPDGLVTKEPCLAKPNSNRMSMPMGTNQLDQIDETWPNISQFSSSSSPFSLAIPNTIPRSHLNRNDNSNRNLNTKHLMPFIPHSTPPSHPTHPIHPIHPIHTQYTSNVYEPSSQSLFQSQGRPRGLPAGGTQSISPQQSQRLIYQHNQTHAHTDGQAQGRPQPQPSVVLRSQKKKDVRLESNKGTKGCDANQTLGQDRKAFNGGRRNKNNGQSAPGSTSTSMPTSSYRSICLCRNRRMEDRKFCACKKCHAQYHETCFHLSSNKKKDWYCYSCKSELYNPFFKVERIISGPHYVEFLSRATKSRFEFTVTADDLESLRRVHAVKKPHNIILSSFISSEHLEDGVTWPTRTQLRINGLYINLPQKLPPTAMEPVKLFQEQPLNILSYVTVGRNVIEIEAGENFSLFCFLIQTTAERTVNDIMTIVKQNSVEWTYAQAKEDVKKHFVAEDEDDVVATSVVVVTKCPLTFTDMKIPVRGKGCPHLQCLDLENFLEFNRTPKSRQWCCITCHHYIPLYDLRIDPYMKQILHDLKTEMGNVEEIEIFPDGTWKKRGENGDENLKREKTPNKASQKTTKLNGEEGKNNRKNKKPLTQVDLTLSDSDGESENNSDIEDKQRHISIELREEERTCQDDTSVSFSPSSSNENEKGTHNESNDESNNNSNYNSDDEYTISEKSNGTVSNAEGDILGVEDLNEDDERFIALVEKRTSFVNLNQKSPRPYTRSQSKLNSTSNSQDASETENNYKQLDSRAWENRLTRCSSYPHNANKKAPCLFEFIGYAKALHSSVKGRGSVDSTIVIGDEKKDSSYRRVRCPAKRKEIEDGRKDEEEQEEREEEERRKERAQVHQQEHEVIDLLSDSDSD